MLLMLDYPTQDRDIERIIPFLYNTSIKKVVVVYLNLSQFKKENAHYVFK